MRKTAPGWGKAIGIIMICLGGLGIFYQIYKLIMPMFFNSFPIAMNNLSHLDNNPYNDVVINEFSNLFGFTQLQVTMLVVFGILGLVLTIFYIMGGVKLLSVAPANYNFAKFALIAFVVLNALACVFFFTTRGGMFMTAIMMYSLIGLVFDITLLIILLSSNKADYGIGSDEQMQVYSVDRENEEIL